MILNMVRIHFWSSLIASHHKWVCWRTLQELAVNVFKHENSSKEEAILPFDVLLLPCVNCFWQLRDKKPKRYKVILSFPGMSQIRGKIWKHDSVTGQPYLCPRSSLIFPRPSMTSWQWQIEQRAFTQSIGPNGAICMLIHRILLACLFPLQVVSLHTFTAGTEVLKMYQKLYDVKYLRWKQKHFHNVYKIMQTF